MPSQNSKKLKNANNMKKLQKLILHKAKIMTAPQMKHITGGYDDGESGTCGVAIWSGDSWMIGCGLSKSYIDSIWDLYSGPKNWCCDSCSSTWYCGSGSGGN
jgi:hypothetical protein